MPAGFGLAAAEGGGEEPSAWPWVGPPGMCWAKAGRERYEQIAASARRLRQRPQVRRLTEQALAKLDRLSGQAADKLQAARQSTLTGEERRWAADHCGAETPTGPPPALGVVAPVDLASMPAVPTVRSGEDAEATDDPRRPAPPDPPP